ELALAAPVAGRLLEGRHGEREHQDGADGAEREGFAGQFEETAPPALDAEAAEEDDEPLPPFRKPETRVIEGGIDPGVEFEQEGGARPLAFLRLEWIFHLLTPGSRPANSIRRH